MSKKKIETQRVVTMALSKSQFDHLVGAIEKLAKAVAAAQIRENQSTEQKARFLRAFGMTEPEITDILGITQSGVSRALKAKKKLKRSKRSSSYGAVSKT